LFSKEDGTLELEEEYAKAIQANNKQNVVEKYSTMHHGWMGARAELTDKENAKEFERGYSDAFPIAACKGCSMLTMTQVQSIGWLLRQAPVKLLYDIDRHSRPSQRPFRQVNARMKGCSLQSIFHGKSFNTAISEDIT